MAKAKEPKQKPLPKSPAACADLLYRVREQRLAMQKEVDKLAAEENRLKEYFIQTLPKSDATGIAGRVARVQTGTKLIPQVEDWTAFYSYVKRTGSFDLLQKRLSEGAVKERWDDRKTIPGVGTFQAVTVSVTKL